ncbi:hypothetical protein EVG20_g8962 [Dentipellis fragilis]|uniref:GAR domain-containing protein n=1 Tax=Dentipellis fragilis TaxID=205917 RepID=A0A4Y9Y1U2_9AGAM|nr:hypothetical protein EVG20_g8962 [Dentipellis fragilis]
MGSLSVSSSRASSLHSASQHSLIINLAPPLPSSPGLSASSSSSSSSSKLSLDRADEENATITLKHPLTSSKGKDRSCDDLQILAISTHITELSYTMSDIQTRIFEIQELRHKSQSSGDLASATSVIDQSLMALDERLESLSTGIKAVNESIDPLVQRSKTQTSVDENSESALLLRKHAAFLSDWTSVQEDSEVLREELKEDKWLTVFRTVTDQADGMMTSLEKAVNRCQEFIWQVQRYGTDEPSVSQSSSLASMASTRSEKSPISMEVFQSLLDSFEAKKKSVILHTPDASMLIMLHSRHYMPATNKVLSIIDKGVQDRVTKNGECLRRHAESTQRWKNLRERITRTDTEMENWFHHLRPTSKSKSRNGFLTPPSGAASGKKTKGSSAASTLSRSMSPLRKFARKLTGASKSSSTNVTPAAKLKKQPPRIPSSEPVPTLRHRASVFTLSGNQPATPSTPGHKHTQSMTPDSSPSTTKRVDREHTLKTRASFMKQPWNSSTKIEPDERTVKVRRPSVTSTSYSRPDIPPVPINGSPYKRSLSRSSMASSRPWSPVTSTVSTAPSSNNAFRSQHHPSPSQASYRPPSRARSPGISGTPRPRPQTPSHIPAPAHGRWRSVSGETSDGGWDDDDNPTTLMQRAFSPTFSTSARSETPGNSLVPAPRPPSRSMIPAPTFHFSSPSRPASAMSDYREESPSRSTASSFRSSAMRAQTPEALLRSRAQQVPLYQSQLGQSSGQGYNIKTIRPSYKNPPSSFKDGSSPRTPSRPSSRASVYTPGLEANPTHLYTPGNPRDRSTRRLRRSIPKEGEEVRAQYAFSTSLARKVVTCRLTTLSRNSAKGEASTTTKKVMVRVGGGWQDLQFYMLNRQAGL